jgi:localization factor PodJL
MQSELPWNVAGIAPEAREAARVSARREGLSVGEWLTRHILSDLPQETDTPLEPLGAPDTTGFRAPSDKLLSAQASMERLARVARSQHQSHDAGRRIEEHFMGLQRRLQQTERSQSENNRAIRRAAEEISIASRGQTQAFGKLGAQVVGLNERVARLEKRVSADVSREAIKALHLGLSRLADQITETANRSAAHAEQLAASIESVAGKLSQSQSENQRNSHALENRIEALTAHVDTIAAGMAETRSDAEHDRRAIDERVAAMESRVHSAERAALASVDAIEKALVEIQVSQTARKTDEAEIHHHDAALTQLSESLDRLIQRFSASENGHADAVARVEAEISRIETAGRAEAVDGHLREIGKTLAAIGNRIEEIEQENASFSNGVLQNLRDLGVRMDAADKRHGESLAAAAPAASESRATPEIGPPAPPPNHSDAVARIDLPPIADALPSETQAVPPNETESSDLALEPDFSSPNVGEVRTPDQVRGRRRGESSYSITSPSGPSGHPSSSAGQALLHDEGGKESRTIGAQRIRDGGIESFSASVRRFARVPPQSANVHRDSIFSWVTPHPAPPAADAGSTMRIVLVGGLALLIILAIAAGVFLSHRIIGSAPPARIGNANAALHPPPVNHALGGARLSKRLPIAAPAPKSNEAASPHDRLIALANSGSAKAQVLLGPQYLDGGAAAVNEAEAAKWLERAARQGEALAAYRLGTLYERGHGVPLDMAKAVEWYEMAARAGNRKAMYNLAVAYAQGTGVEKNLSIAAQWFARAAKLGMPDSQFNLGVLYERGMGVPQSLTEAYKWYSIAATQGDAESKARIDAIATQISAGERAAAEKARAEFRPEPMNPATNSPPDAASLIAR